MTSLLLLALLSAPDAGVLLSKPVQITADKLEVKNKEQRALYTGHAKVVRESATLTCDQLVVFYKGDKNDVSTIEAAGNLLAVDGDKTAGGETATFDNATGVLVVKGKPWAKQQGRTVDGEVVTFTTGSEEIVVTKAKTRSSGEAVGQQQAPVEIDADTLSLVKGTATWTGNVHARRGTTKLDAPLLIARYDEKGELQKLEARGGVEATDQDRWARGARADYDAKSGRLVVTGKPQARQGNNRMKGSRVTFITGQDTLEVENAETILDAPRKTKP